jgi:hypothetical protein
VRIKKVKYVERSRPNGLSDYVNELIAKGWQPKGYPIVDRYGYLVQMMVQYAEDSQL